jgi:HEAT repeat protein
MTTARPSTSIQLAAAAILATGAFAHNDPPPAPPIVLHVGSKTIAPQPWTWIHWWEANRDPYLRSRQWPSEARPEQEDAPPGRDEAVQRLEEAAAFTSPLVRAEVAIALGRIGRASSLDVLKKLLMDPDPAVRGVAVVALSLLNGIRSPELLADHLRRGDLAVAALAGLGLVEHLGDDHLDMVRKQLASPDRAVSRMSAWALRLHKSESVARSLREVLERTPDPWLASESILALGRQGKKGPVRPLVEILLATDAGVQFTAYRELERQRGELWEA